MSDDKKEEEVWSDGKIINREIVNEMKTAYIDYAMSVIVQRALPDVRDGLKPVHRRILYTMYEDGLTTEKPYRKSATTVGDVLGRYHPHGDASVYDAMVRLAQDFTMRYPLIDGHGNFGSIDGDGAAAYRYTEARMSKIAEQMLQDIEKNTVDFMPNFDGIRQEPTVLPNRFPALLVNGSSGIAVGMATNIPPHNIKEILNAVIKMVECREEDTEITDDDLLKIVKGPDFPTGATILGKEGIKEAYLTGKGKIVQRAEAEIEEMSGNRQKIVITSLPYQVNKAKLIVDINNLAKDKKVEGISEVRDESDREEKVRVVVELKRDANAQVVLNRLYKNTQMQNSFGVIILALVDNVPKILTLRQCLDYYIDHRREVIKRRTKFDLDKALARAHILEGLRIAIDNIDEVIKIIRASYDDPKERLMERFGLDDIQAQAILDMQLRRLSGLQREKIEEEYKQLMELIEHLRAILADEKLVYNLIKEESLETIEKFGDDRLTKIVRAQGEFEEEDLIKDEETIISLTHFGYIKRVPLDTYRSQKRGGKGITGLTTREEDFVKQIFKASTHDTILFFSNKGKMYRLRGFDIPEGGRTAKGTAIVNLLALEPGEKITAVIPLKSFEDSEFLLMATRSGLIKKTPLKEYDSGKKTGLIAINLKEENDELIDVRLTDGNNDVVLVTRKGICITFSEQDVRPVGRTAQGVIGIRLDSDDYVIGMEKIYDRKNGTLLSITENGFGKRTELEEYRVQTRGGKGVITYKITPKTGEIVGIRICDDRYDVMMITDNGTVIRIPAKDVSVLGRNTQGVTLMRTNDGGKIVSIETISPDEEENVAKEDSESK
jgi:DNA gyrase subunit A